MEKFTKLSRAEMKNVLGGQDELTVDPGMTGGDAGCKNECLPGNPCTGSKNCTYVGCGGTKSYYMCV